MRQRIAVSSVAIAVLMAAACTDREGGTRAPTEAGDPAVAVQYVTTHTAEIMNPRTHRLESVGATPAGVSASIVGSVVTQSAFQIQAGEVGIAPTAGHTSWTFTDSTKHAHKIVLLYRTGGGPPAAMQHYVDGGLVSTTAYSWLRTTQGWTRTRSFTQSLNKGQLVGTYTSLTTIPKSGPNPGPPQPVRFEHDRRVSPSQRVLGTIAYALAFSFAPQDATAQFYFGPCRQQWLKYAAAGALLAGVAVAMGAAPELSPALITSFIASLATAGAAEDLLLDCMIANESVSMGGFGGGGFGGGGFGGAGGAGGSGSDDCLEGSYAAHCTTPFTL